MQANQQIDTMLNSLENRDVSLEPKEGNIVQEIS